MTLNVGADFRLRASVDGQQALDRFNQSLATAGRQGQVSAGQINAAMRTLPAQLTDVATQLAGGQSPFLILLQQGGQIRDQFGSVGAALRGIASTITPFTVGIGAAAAAVGGLAMAFVQGQAELTAFTRALATTGNFAGVTADRFNEAAGRIQQASGQTALASRELLQAVIATGQFGPASYEAVAQAAARVQRITGQAAGDVVKQFAGLSRGAADWAAETNKTYNFLDVAQYRYIRSLEEAGDKEGAQRVAADALTKALGDRTVQLGTLEKAWKGVTGAASAAWNAMLNIGREETTGESLTDLEDQLARINRRLTDAGTSDVRTAGVGMMERQRDALQARINGLRQAQNLEGQNAALLSIRARENQKAIAEERKAEEDRKRNTTARVSDFDQILRGLQDQLASTQELTVRQNLLREIEAGRYQGLSPAQRQRLLDLAGEVDRTKALKEAAEESQRTQERAGAAAARQAGESQRELDVMRQRWLDVIDPVEKYRRQLEEIDDLQNRGALSAAQATEARFRVQEQIEDLNKVKEAGRDTFDELKNAVEGWGRSATDAFVDFAFTGKASFGDLVSSILKDLARMVIQKNVMGPIFNTIGGSMGGGGGFGGILSSIGSIFGFAKGGDHRGGLRIVGEEGPELEATGPSRIFNADQTRRMLSGGGSGPVSIGITINAQTGQSTANGDTGSQLKLLGERIAAGAREVILQEQRPGGMLAGA
jgi:phage-related minor tail protein